MLGFFRGFCEIVKDVSGFGGMSGTLGDFAEYFGILRDLMGFWVTFLYRDFVNEGRVSRNILHCMRGGHDD
jgi:hypothetical protein